MSVSSYARGGLGGSPDGLPAHQPKRVAGHKLPSLGTLPRPGRGISGADGAYQSKRAPRTLPPGVAIGSNTPGTTAPHLCRRSLLLLGGASVHLGLAEAADAHRQQIAVGSVAAAGSPTAAPQPLVDVPMARLRLPASTAGRDYVLVSLKIRGQGPFDFMVDSGLTAELITPHLKEVLGVRPAGKQHVTGLGAGGASPPGQVVELIEASLCGGRGSREELQLPPLHAVVQGFPQEHLDPGHDPVEGMLGMEVLSLFDADFDFPAGRLRLWPPGSAAEAAEAAGMVAAPGAVLNETGLIGIRITSADHEAGGGQPMVGIVDCGASFTTVNWAGASLLNLPGRSEIGAYKETPPVYAVGVDGRPLPLLRHKARLSFAGDPYRDDQGCPLAGDIGKFPPITAVDGAALLGFCVSVGNLCGSPALGHVTRSALALIPGAAPGHPCGLCGREGMVSAGRLTGHSTAGNLKFAPPAPSWQPWEPIDIAVGDLPAFPQLLGDGTKPYRGPALLLGLDVLSQRRLIIEAGTDDKSRRRRLFIGAT